MVKYTCKSIQQKSRQGEGERVERGGQRVVAKRARGGVGDRKRSKDLSQIVLNAKQV